MAKDHNEKDEKYIKLNNIDTSTAAKNFAELLNEKNKTYFLNGNWGSGKSTFLQEVNSTKDVKLVTIDFWRLNDSRSTLETVFAKLHPIVYWTLRLFVILCVALSILMTNVVDLGLSVLVPSWVISISGIVALLVAIHQFFKIKSNGFYSWLLSREYRSRKKKILVVDDFDRMTNEQQEASYKVFSLLNGKLPIVFVGDIDRLHRNVDNYLSKIIDRRINLPYDLHPSKIWYDYFNQLEKKFKMVLPENFKKFIINDNKNLRDREHFNDYVNIELIDRKKEKHVQIEQQFVIIYIYIFNHDLYNYLLNGGMLYSTDDSINTLIHILNKDYKNYPSSFKENREAYFINEEPNNRTLEELKSIVENNQQVFDEIKFGRRDFAEFLEKDFEKLDYKYGDSLFTIALNYSLEGSNNQVIDTIIKEKIKKLIPEYDPMKITQKVINEVKEFLGGNLETFDYSEIFYYVFKHKIIRLADMRGKYMDVTINSSEFSLCKRKEQIILMELYNLDILPFFSQWDEIIWEKINELDDESFINFWLQVGFFYNTTNDKSLNQVYRIATESELRVNSEEISFVLQEINHRLNELKKRNYIFTRDT